MKLLEKSQINSIKNSETKKSIDEGVNIARKIDVLRETLLTLEKQHSDFIAKSNSEISGTIDKLLVDKTHLVDEITELEKKKKKLLEPLDAEWAIVKEKTEEIEKRELEVSSKEIEIKIKENNLTIKQNELDKIYIQQNDTLTQEQALKMEIEEIKKEIADTLDKVRREQTNFENEKAEKTKRIEEKEKQLENAKKMYEIKSNQLKEKETKVTLLLRRLEYNERNR